MPRPHLPSGVANAVEVQKASVCKPNTIGRPEAGDGVVTFFELADPAPDEVKVTLTLALTRTLSLTLTLTLTLTLALALALALTLTPALALTRRLTRGPRS